jgi:hypothetical protein
MNDSDKEEKLPLCMRVGIDGPGFQWALAKSIAAHKYLKEGNSVQDWLDHGVTKFNERYKDER